MEFPLFEHLSTPRLPQDVFESKTFTFIVGPERARFTVHSLGFTKLSRYFGALMEGDMEEARKGVVIWKDVEVKTFLRLHEFVYTRDFTIEPPSPPPEVLGRRMAQSLNTTEEVGVKAGTVDAPAITAYAYDTEPALIVDPHVQLYMNLQSWLGVSAHMWPAAPLERKHFEETIEGGQNGLFRLVIESLQFYHAYFDHESRPLSTPPHGAKFTNWIMSLYAGPPYSMSLNSGTIPFVHKCMKDSTVLIEYAKLYVLGDMYCIDSIRQHVIFRMQTVLSCSGKFPKNFNDFSHTESLVEFVRYVFDNTLHGDPLQRLAVVAVAVWFNLEKDFDRLFVLMQEVGDLCTHLIVLLSRIKSHFTPTRIRFGTLNASELTEFSAIEYLDWQAEYKIKLRPTTELAPF